MNFIYEYLYKGFRKGMVEDGSVGGGSGGEASKASSAADPLQGEGDDDSLSQHSSEDDSEVIVPSSPKQQTPIGETKLEEWLEVIQERIMVKLKREFVEEQEREKETRRVQQQRSS